MFCRTQLNSFLYALQAHAEVQRSLRAATPSRTLHNNPAMIHQASLLMAAVLPFLSLLTAMQLIGSIGVELTSASLSHAR